MADVDEAEVAARAARLQALQDQVTDAGNNVRALKVRESEGERINYAKRVPGGGKTVYRKPATLFYLFFFYPFPSVEGGGSLPRRDESGASSA